MIACAWLTRYLTLLKQHTGADIITIHCEENPRASVIYLTHTSACPSQVMMAQGEAVHYILLTRAWQGKPASGPGGFPTAQPRWCRTAQ